jgi:hypothetical protein
LGWEKSGAEARKYEREQPGEGFRKAEGRGEEGEGFHEVGPLLSRKNLTTPKPAESPRGWATADARITRHYAEDLGEFLPQRSKPFGQQAHEYVLERGRATGKEHLVAFNEDDSVVAHAMGTAKDVALPPSFTAIASDPNNGIVVHHNHPNSGTLSTPDLAQLGQPGTVAIWAHGHNGTVSRAELTPFGKSLMSNNVKANVHGLKNILDAVGNFSLTGC